MHTLLSPIIPLQISRYRSSTNMPLPRKRSPCSSLCSSPERTFTQSAITTPKQVRAVIFAKQDTYFAICGLYIPTHFFARDENLIRIYLFDYYNYLNDSSSNLRDGVKEMKKRSTAVFLIVIFTFTTLSLLSGCKHAVNLGKSYIELYVRENIGLTDFEVSSHPISVKPESSNLTDRLWTVTDNITGVEFHVLDDHIGPGEYSLGTSNELVNDYGQKLILKYAGELPDLSQVDYEFADKQRVYAGKTYDYYEHVREYGFESGYLIGSYRTRTELKKLFDEVGILGEAIKELDAVPPKELYVYFRYMFEDRDGITDGYDAEDLADGMVSVYSSKDGRESEYETYEPNFLEMLLWFRCDEEALGEYTHEEIVNFVTKTDYISRLGVYHGDNDQPDMYDDITSIRLNWKTPVSFGSLFEILKRENYPVEGTARYFKFTGFDGSEYEISYDFKDDPEEYDYGYRWYYIKNGEKIPLSEDHIYAFSFKQVFEMTGVKVTDI